MKEMIRAIARAVQAQGGRALLVGGCVRDGLLGLDSADIDCEVHGVPPQALRALLSPFGELDESGAPYGIYTLRGQGIDVALPRTERRTGPGHRDFTVTLDPDLSPERAAARRDFTVNAIMRDALTGEYIDPFGGIGDLRAGVLRAVPAPGFEDDPLRVLRGAQFAARFSLAPDTETLVRMRRMPMDGLSGARVMGEMKKALLCAEHPQVFFGVLSQAGALFPWFEELSALRGVQQNAAHHPEGDAWAHTMLVLGEAARVRSLAADSLAFMLAALCHDLGKAVSVRRSARGEWTAAGHEQTGVPLVRSMLGRLCAPKAAVRYAADMCALHMRAHICYFTGADESQTNLLFDASVCPRELMLLAVCDSRGTGKPREAADREERFLTERLSAYERAVGRGLPDARAMLAAGAAPGPGLGDAVREAWRLALCGESSEKAAQRAAQAIEGKQA